MAGDANAYGLFQRAVESNIPYVSAVTESFYKTNCVLKDLPLVTEAVLSKRGIRTLGGVPIPAWGDINAGTTSWQQTPQGFTETAYGTRDNIDIDLVDMINKDQVGGPGGARARRLKWYMTGYAFEYNYRFIQGTHRNDSSGSARYNPRAIVGLRERLDNSAYQAASDMLINGNGLDISRTGANKFAAGALIELVKQAIDYVGGGDDGTNCVLYHNDFFKRAFERCLANAGTDGGWGFVKDPYDNLIPSYRNCKFRDMGRLAPTAAGVQTGRVISQFEKADGTDGTNGTDTFTSFYVVRWEKDGSEGSTMTAWEMAPLEAVDLGRINDGVTYRTVWIYQTGLFQENTRAISRVYGLNLGPV